VPPGGSTGGVRYNPRLVRVEDHADAVRLLKELGADRGGVAIMSRKMRFLVVEVENVKPGAAHILKQVMLSKGGECATPREVFLTEDPVRVIMMGTVSQYQKAIKNLSAQPFGLGALSDELAVFLGRALTGSGETRFMRAGDHELVFGGRTLLMGVLNTTPDSFSDGGRYDSREKAVARALEMAGAGADIIDIGGESTRPGAEPLSEEEEIGRTVPVIETVAGETGVPISIDTYKSNVARRALEAGASMVNDISGLRFDPGMIGLLAETGAPVVIMHMQGTPRNMQEDPEYRDVVSDIVMFLRDRMKAAVDGGVDPGVIMVDPGIGFGKTAEHNLEIMRRLEEFKCIDCPLLVGTSRKSFIGKVLGRPADERIMGTAATVSFAISRGVDVVRVHDVEEMTDVVRMADSMAGRLEAGRE
jgi:dihydropteroate synthase